ncbi:LytTR family DNA-binding domain-containing protein [Fulvivirgaceae bacterium PWU4]|uniref:LytTR family DNA-binding domain-containing protein n=1 Tax=Chryseosolibacter histidini TaxID=2782349 RepID=A0AAP2DU24_9BACT|nr:LytTR family DNA-binding domain-containing protein [Chryseosolibacter histidini]MBT1701338.1 LytTR family DNA-binding domain-containing protein [Chryseosolibacter histidini]
MTQYTCLIVDDEPLARNLLTEYVKKVSFLKLVHTCSNPLEALELLRNNPVDILFLDIQMPEITGITFLKILQKKPLVILTTAYSEYALESYELDVVDYLLKPITFDRFLKAVDKAGQRLNTGTAPVAEKVVPSEPTQPFVFVKDGTKLVKINFDDILYVEGLKDYVTIHTKTQKVVSLQRLKSLELQLPADRFIRIHHSYIVALKAIDVIHKGEVQIGNAMIPISDTYRKTFKEFVDRNQMQ